MPSRLTVLTLLLVTALARASGDKPFHNLQKRIRALMETTPGIERGYLGFKIVDAQTGAVVMEQNAGSFFTPASNTKLYTTALALTRLGPYYTFQTQLSTQSPWSQGQPTLSDLRLIGGGDPELSGRVLPYDVNAHDGDPLAPLQELADKLFNLGIREIQGDVIGVSTRYASDFYPDGWTLDDSTYGYGAPISALALNDNSVSVTVYPTTPGELASLSLAPPFDYLTISNQIITDISRSTQIKITHPAGSTEIVLWGTIGKNASAWKEDFAVDDPALFAATALIDTLRNRGITVRGEARAEYCTPNQVTASSNRCGTAAAQPETLLATHQSVPLYEAVQVINKVSDNLEAEMLLREAAHVTTGVGTLEAGLKVRDDFLSQIGITRDGTGFAFADGSGLARQGLTTPDSTVTLLRYMWQQPDQQVWLQSLPIGGVDGSLQHRFRKIRQANRVHAKTGSFSHVNTLSGYIETETHGWLAFSIMVNSTTLPDSKIRDFLDQFCSLFLEE